MLLGDRWEDDTSSTFVERDSGDEDLLLQLLSLVSETMACASLLPDLPDLPLIDAF